MVSETWPAVTRENRADEVIRVYVGIVHAGDMICHVCADLTRSQLYSALGEYVRESAPLQLWPEESDRVMSLLSYGRFREAVELYFNADPQRWAPERLTIASPALLPTLLAALRLG